MKKVRKGMGEEHITITEASDYTGLKVRYIHHAIHAGIISPKTKKYGTRDVYQFTPDEIEVLKAVAELRFAGLVISEIVHYLKNKDEYEKCRKSFIQALAEWEDEGSDETWRELISAIASSPALTEFENSLLRMIYEGHTVEECATELQITSSEVKTNIEKAKLKAFKYFIPMLRARIIE